MLNISYKQSFLDVIRKIKDNNFKDRVKKLVKKITEDPEVGKPMQYERKGTREVYAGSFRLSYSYIKEQNELVFLNIYHKDEQ
jgi:mRNA-degrading endonuclease RelE of RelBE toxin-antitoxin system